MAESSVATSPNGPWLRRPPAMLLPYTTVYAPRHSLRKHYLNVALQFGWAVGRTVHAISSCQQTLHLVGAVTGVWLCSYTTYIHNQPAATLLH